jgi:hypothetical protein
MDPAANEFRGSVKLATARFLRTVEKKDAGWKPAVQNGDIKSPLRENQEMPG